jgi:hypothetical protein
MIGRFRTLPRPVRLLVALIAAITTIAALLFFYDVLGTSLLDSGGSLG